MIKVVKLFFFVIIAAAIGSCSSSKKTTTDIMSTWKKPNVAAKTFSSIFVSVLTNDTAAKQAIENAIQNKLTPRLKVFKSTDVFPPGFEAENKDNQNALLEKIRPTNADGILTIALLDKRTEAYHTPGTLSYEPLQRHRYFGQFATYYGTRASVIYEPGYYTKDQVYYLETNLYDTKTGELIWSAQSATYNPSDINTFLDGYLKSLREYMMRDGLISER